MFDAPESTLLRNANLFDPAPRGRCDILLGGGRVLAIADRICELPAAIPHAVVDLDGATVTPGLVDAHAHVAGGGGEAGFASRVPPLRAEDFTGAGVTSIVGLLGTDTTTRTMRDLVARTLGLREEGLSAWCWTGGYAVPPCTLTGSVRDDIVFVDPIIGVGELAISDHRSSQPTLDEFLRIAADVHVAGMTTGKAGVVHLHLGDGVRQLELVVRALATSELPPRVFHPTHVNRNRELWDAVRGMARTSGLCFDVTAFPADEVGDGLTASDAIAQWLAEGLPASALTCSSDGGGCMPHWGDDGRIVSFGVGKPSTLLLTLRSLVRDRGVSLADALPMLTSNVAKLLRLPGKGRVQVGSDADLLVLDASLQLREVYAGGRPRPIPQGVAIGTP